MEEKAVRSAKMAHLSHVKAEQISYAQRQLQAVQAPGQYMSLILDHSEKILLPHRIPFVKNWLRLNQRYALTPVGVMDHSGRNHLYLYESNAWPKDSNLVILILY